MSIKEPMKLLLIAASLALTGCAISPEQMPITGEPKEFTYDYAAPGKSKVEIFKAAQNYLALAYADSRAITRSADQDDGTIIGKAIVPWSLSTGSALVPSMPCGNHFNIVFIAKDGKARMQLTLLEGAAMPINCPGWPLPPKRDYPQIVQKFNATSRALDAAINGKSAMDSLKNF